jgi:hypothetical protein
LWRRRRATKTNLSFSLRRGVLFFSHCYTFFFFGWRELLHQAPSIFPSLHKRENSLRFPFLLHRNAIKVCALHGKPKFSMITTREAYLIIVSAAAAGLEK